MDTVTLKARVDATIEQLSAQLIDVSHRIHERPELNFEEHHAHGLLCDVLEGHGLTPTRGYLGLDTAFRCDAGTEGPVIGLCLEYDALPGIGHACGHNIIAAAGLGAGLAAATLAAECGGRVAILGTPAEEGGGGKVFMIRGGAFDDVDAALMIHPAGADLRSMRTIAIQQCVATYEGLSAHAAAAPELGRNALDAAILGYLNVAALRQHIRPDERIHGIVTDGGDKPNIVPARAQTSWYVRSPDLGGLADLKPRVEACLVAGAQASGCTVDIVWVDPPYSDMLDSAPILDAYVANAAGVGRVVHDPAEVGEVVGSTDMGDVSYVVPSIHPMIQAAPAGTAIHTEAFAAAAASPDGDRAVLDGARVLAHTVIDLWLDRDLLASARVSHRRRIELLGP